MTAYVNPFGASLVQGGRVDEGVDPTIRGPIRAVGNARVETVTHFSGFGTYLAYRLLDGPQKGRRIFISEGIAPHVNAGQTVRAGQIIATGTGAIETGWAGGPGGSYLPEANKAQGGSYTEGKATAQGRSFDAFLNSLGAHAGPGGKLRGKPGGAKHSGAGSLGDKILAFQTTGAISSALGLRDDVGKGVAGVDQAAANLDAGIAKAVVGLLFDSIGKDGLRALLYVVLVAGGVALMLSALNRATGGAVTDAAKTGAKVAKVAAVAAA